jgi:hypothetical protein
MAKESGSKAPRDAGISFNAVEQAHVGYIYGDSTSGRRAVYELGMAGIPITNVNNNCSTARHVNNAKVGLQHNIGLVAPSSLPPTVPQNASEPRNLSDRDQEEGNFWS